VKWPDNRTGTRTWVGPMGSFRLPPIPFALGGIKVFEVSPHTAPHRASRRRYPRRQGARCKVGRGGACGRACGRGGVPECPSMGCRGEKPCGEKEALGSCTGSMETADRIEFPGGRWATDGGVVAVGATAAKVKLQGWRWAMDGGVVVIEATAARWCPIVLGPGQGPGGEWQ